MIPLSSVEADDLVIVGQVPVLDSLQKPRASTLSHETKEPYSTPNVVEHHIPVAQQIVGREANRWSIDPGSIDKEQIMRSPMSNEADALPPPPIEPFTGRRGPIYHCRGVAPNEINGRPLASLGPHLKLPFRPTVSEVDFQGHQVPAPKTNVPHLIPLQREDISNHAPTFVTSPQLLPPPPPPPPPPVPPFASSATSFCPDAQVSSPAALVPVSYSGESILETSRIIRIESFKRNVLVSQHGAQAADLAEYEWLLIHGNTEVWYEKPHKAFFRQMRNQKGKSYGDLELLPLYDARPVSLETPKLWASRALSTPTDDDVYDCTAGHSDQGSYASTCHRCSEEKSEALDATSLQYCIIMTTCQASNPFIHGSHFNGRQIYKVVKCGSREAAVSEAFYATGVNGWNITFSCVLRLGEGFDERNGKIRRVEELWQLADDDDAGDEENIRVFY